MKKFYLTCMAIAIAAGLTAQPAQGQRSNAAGGGITVTNSVSTASPAGTSEAKNAVYNIPFNPESTITSEHEVTIKGNKVPYKTTAGMMPVWDDEGKVQAGVFFTYYERTDIKDRAARPLVISFNGGPGTPSVWMEWVIPAPASLLSTMKGIPCNLMV